MRSTKLGLAIVAIVLMTTVAYANPKGTNTNTQTLVNTNTATGGAGGAGGQGGQGGKGGDAISTSSSHSNAQQLQGQRQGQGQNQNQSNSAVGQGNTTTDSMSSTNNVKRSAASAIAADNTTSDACMGSSSIAGQGMVFGFGIGTTWTDSNCQRLRNAKALAQFGQTRAAVALLCNDSDVRTAMNAAGTPCPQAERTVSSAPGPSYAQNAQVPYDQPETPAPRPIFGR